MKKVLSLGLALIMIVAVFCGCTQEYTIKVNKDDSCKITTFAAIPVETMEEMTAGMEEDDESMSELEDMEIKKVNGKDCYVEEETEKFSSTKKASKFMLEGDEDTGSNFERFTLTNKGISAKMIEGTEDSAALYGDDMVFDMKITFPYLITKTNGKLSEDKKTVTFDLLKGGKLYAYTTKSPNAAKIYFIEEYLKSNNSVFLNWKAVKGVKNYKVEYKVSGAKKWNSVTATKSAKTIKNLKAGKKYYFRVTAITKSGNYTSQKIAVNTLKKVAVKVKSKTDKSIKLSWKKDTTADGYIVYQKNSKNGDWKKLTTIKKDSTVTYTAKGLEGEKTYYFKVISYKNVNGKTIKSTFETLKAKTY